MYVLSVMLNGYVSLSYTYVTTLDPSPSIFTVWVDGVINPSLGITDGVTDVSVVPVNGSSTSS